MLPHRKISRPLELLSPNRARRPLIHFLRLAGFGFAALFLSLAALLVFEDYQTMKSETGPASRSVDLPSDLDIPVEEVTFPASGGIRLASWFVPSTNGATIILLHGYGGTRVDMLWHARTLVKAGYGVLLYDERASGESEGDHRSYGWEDGPDVGGAIAFIQDRAGGKTAHTGILGCSIGGQIALQGAILYPEIAAVWADGPANITAADSPPPQNLALGLVSVSDHLLDFLYQRRLHISPPPPLIERLHQIAPRPLMLVGGGTPMGPFGSEAARVDRFARFAGPNARVWVIADAVHCDGPARQPQEYAQRLVQFFDDAFAFAE